VLCLVIAGCGSSKTAAGMPSSFVGVSQSKHEPGIAVYSTRTGQLLRRLTDGAADIDPMMGAGRRYVYFVHVNVPHVCPVQLWRVPFSGGRATMISTNAGYPGGPVAVSPDGKLLAFISTAPGKCNLSGLVDWLELVNLQTGATRWIHGDVWSLAWSPNDKTLAVASPTTSGGGVIHLISNPFKASSPTAGPSVRCPAGNPCSETTPSFDAAGQLFYTATVTPTDSDACWAEACSGWHYSEVAVHGTSATVLSTVRRTGNATLTGSIVDTAGDAMLYSLPGRGNEDGLALWHWSAAGPVAIAAPGANAQQPTW
jgi:Tol biopolymer transport system component